MILDKRMKFFITVGLFFCTSLMFACECFIRSKCDEVTSSTLVMGMVEKIYYDGELMPKGKLEYNKADILEYIRWMQGRKIAYFRVLDSDDSTIIGELIKVYVDIGSSCSSDMSYGYYSIRWGFDKEGDTITTGVNSCTEKNHFLNYSEAQKHYLNDLALKQECLTNKNENVIIVKKGTFEFKDVFRLERYPEIQNTLNAKWDSVSNNLRDIIPASNTAYSYRLYMTINVLPSGEVFNVDIVKGAEAVEPYYELFIQEIKKTSFPKIKSNVGEGFESYKVTLPLNLGNTH